MTDRVVLEIPGKPMGKQRRVRTRAGHTYMPEETVNYETFIKMVFVSEYPSFNPFRGPVDIDIMAWFPVPKSVSKKRRIAMLAGEIRPLVKPDWDNIGKIVCDSLNGVAWLDDKQLDGRVSKRYSDNPRVVITIDGTREEEA